MSATTLPAALRDLATAEEFLEFFDLPYDPAVVRVKRLHILQRFHDYLAHADIPEGDEGAAWWRSATCWRAPMPTSSAPTR